MNRFALCLAIIVVLGLILLGCGATAAPTAIPMLSKGGASGPSFAPAAPAPAAAPTRAAVSESTTAQDTAASAANDTARLIIRNGSITLTVKNVSDTVGMVTDIANAAGGYVLSSSSRYQGESLLATLTIKVPAESFDDVMAKLRKLAIKVEAENSSSQDVTEEFVDLSARLKVYEATEQQLLTFLQKTQNVDESLKVYRELTNVRSQIESTKGRMNYLQKSAAMSTITVQAQPEPKEQPIVEEKGWNPLKVVRDALRWLVSALEFVFNLLVFVIVGLVPILIAIAIPVLIVRAIWRRLRRKPAK
jgi:hypothetical protein